MNKNKIQLYLSVFIFFWALFALTNNGIDLSEGRYHYLLAEQIVRNGRLDFDSVPPDSVFSVAPSGKLYASHEIGNALFLLPTAFFNIFLEKILLLFASKDGITRLQEFILSFQAGAYSAITATTFFAILQTRFYLPVASSFLATLCLVVTTFFWAYSRILFDGVLSSTLLTLSFFFLSNYRLKNKFIDLEISFICLGFAFITRLSMIFAIMVSLIYLYGISKPILVKWRSICAALLILLPFFTWQCWYNYLRTGLFYLSAVQLPQYAVNNALDGNIFVGVLGYLISPGKSVFVYAPLLVLSVILFRRFYRSYRQEAIYVLTLSIFWLLLHSKIRSWYGAWGWGPRFFITILPILLLPFASSIDYVLKKSSLRITATILGIFGFVLSLSSIISNFLVRIDYAIQNQTFDDDKFIWGFWNSQSVDMLKAGIGNFLRIITQSPVPQMAKIYSKELEYAANTVNIWSNYVGTDLRIPLYIRVLPVIFLLLLMYFSLRNIFSKKLRVI